MLKSFMQSKTNSERHLVAIAPLRGCAFLQCLPGGSRMRTRGLLLNLSHHPFIYTDLMYLHTYNPFTYLVFTAIFTKHAHSFQGSEDV